MGWEALASGDPSVAFALLAEDVVIENGPGAGPWRHLEGREALAEMYVQFVALFEGGFRQEGRCIYADDRQAISLVREVGVHTKGDRFDNQAIYVARFRPDGQIDRLWTIDLDSEAVESFWKRNPVA